MAELNSGPDHEVAVRGSQDRLRNSDAQFQLLVNSVENYAIYMLDANGSVVTWNLGAERIHGWKEQEMIGKSYDALFTKEDLRKGKPGQILAYATAHGHFHEEGMRIRKNGSSFIADITITAVHDDHGGIVGFAKVVKDITEEKTQEGSIQKIATRLALAHTIGKISTFEWDMKTNIIEASPNHESLYGLPPGALQGRMDLWEKTLHPDDRARATAYLQQAIQTKEPIDFEFRVVWPDKSIHWIRAQGVVYYDSQGNPVRSVGVNIDITDYKTVEQEQQHVLGELRESNSALQSATADLEFQKYALDQSSIVAITDANGMIMYVNDKFCEISGYSREELIGQNHRLINSGHHSREFFSQMYKRIVKGHVWRGEIRNKRKDGSYYWVDTTIVPFIGVTGRPERYVAIRNDISERKAVEEKLRHNEQWLRQITDNVPALVSYIDADLRYRFVNRTYEEWFGLSESESIGKSVQELLGDDAAKRLVPYMKRALDGEEVTFEDWITYERAGLRYIRATYAPHRDGDRIDGIFVLVADLTERVRAEEALQRSHDQLNVILQGITDGVTAATPDGRFIYANETAAKIIGFSSVEELLNAEMAEIVKRFEMFREDGTRYEPGEWPTQQALQGTVVVDEMVHFKVKATGEERSSIVSAQPIFDRQGKVDFVVNIFRDVTEEIRSHRKIQENQQRLQFLAEISATLTSSIEYQDTLKNITQRMVPEIADWAAIDMLNDDSSVERLAVAHVDPEKIALAYRLQQEFPYDPDAPTGVAKVLRTGETEFIPIITKEMLNVPSVDKRRREIAEDLQLHSYIVVPLIARGKTLGAMTLVMAESGRKYVRSDVEFAEDIARRAAMAVDNARLYKNVQDALAMRDEFFSIASHELKTPVTSIKAFLQALEQRMGNPEKFDFAKNRQYMQLSVKQVDRLASIINDLLDINKIAQGRMQYHFKPLSIGPVLSDVIERMSVSLPTHKLHMKLEELTAKAMIDELRFEQVVTNLITNAAKYSPEGSTVDIVTRSDEQNIYIDIIDRGIGISEQDQVMIFNRYYRTDEAIKSRVSGLGVGLFISHQLIKAHKGDLSVKSHLGQGSTFTITLPRAP